MTNKFLLALLVFCMTFHVGNALQSGFSGMSTTQKLINQNQIKETSVAKMLGSESMPVGNVVDPEFYSIGPNDVLSIQILPLPSMRVARPIMVTPEMTLLVPSVGELDVRDMTLSQLKSEIKRVVKEKIPNSQVSISLRKSRLVMITIEGNVKNKGTISIPASYRVSTAIKLANKRNRNEIVTPETGMQLEMKLKKHYHDRYFRATGIAPTSHYSMRNIHVLHSNGKFEFADLKKAEIGNDSRYDMYVREGDKITVPFEKEDFPAISVAGEVNIPSILAHKDYDKISDLIKFSGGFTREADLSNIKLYNPNHPTVTNLTISKDMELTGNDELIPDGTIIVVGKKKKEVKKAFGVVSVKGQVGSEGVFMITPGQTKLKEVLEMAGGFTEKAYLPLAYVTRRSENHFNEIDNRLKRMEYFQYSDLKLEDTIRYKLDMSLRKPRVACSIQKLYENNDETSNIILQDGDVVVIPARPETVYVFGQVNHPGYVEYKEDMSMAWYIERAGGYAKGAIEERARIIRGNNQVWVDGAEEVFVFDGDQVYVPRASDIPIGMEWQKYGLISGIIGSATALVTMLITIINISKK